MQLGGRDGNGEMERRMYRETEKWKNGETDGRTDGGRDRKMDEEMDIRTDRHFSRSTGAKRRRGDEM